MLNRKNIILMTTFGSALLIGYFTFLHKPNRNLDYPTSIPGQPRPETKQPPLNESGKNNHLPEEVLKKTAPVVMEYNPNKKDDPKSARGHVIEIAFMKKKYKLSDQQINDFFKKGYKAINIIQMHELAEMTKKSVDELVEKRSSNNSGWGKFVHDQGVAPLKVNIQARSKLAAFVKEEYKGLPPTGMVNPLPSKNKSK